MPIAMPVIHADLFANIYRSTRFCIIINVIKNTIIPNHKPGFQRNESTKESLIAEITDLVAPHAGHGTPSVFWTIQNDELGKNAAVAKIAIPTDIDHRGCLDINEPFFRIESGMVESSLQMS